MNVEIVRPAPDGTGAPPRDLARDDPHPPHIVLLGLTGSGKTTVGIRVANRLGRPFVDNDSMVALRTGTSPSETAATLGETEWRTVEAEALRRVLSMPDALVYAAAASAIDTIEPGDLDTAWCAWLEASPAELAARLERDHPRPRLGAEPQATLEQAHRRCAEAGRRIADARIDTHDRDPEEVADAICDAWHSWVDLDAAVDQA